MAYLTVAELQFLRTLINTKRWPARVEVIKATKVMKSRHDWGYRTAADKAKVLADAKAKAAFRCDLAAKLDALINGEGE